MATDLFKRIETAWWVLPQSGWCQLDLSSLTLYPFASFPPPWQLHASELSRGFLPLPTDHNSRQCARPTGWQVHRGSLTKMTCPVDGVTMSPLVHPYPHYPTPDEALCLALQSSGRIHWVSSDVADWNLRDVGHEVKVTSDLSIQEATLCTVPYPSISYNIPADKHSWRGVPNLLGTTTPSQAS